MKLKSQHSSMKWIWISIFFFTCVYPVYADDIKMDEELDFNISGGNALKVVSHFVEFTKLPIVYNVSELDGLLLNPALGRITPRQAILKMIEGTDLVLDKDKVPGIWIIRKTIPIETEDSINIVIEPDKIEIRPESIFELSPFVVDESDSIGYLSTRTLAGTRLKANLKDVATMLQVATPELIEDTRATDLPSLGPYFTNFEANSNNPYDFRIRGFQTKTITRDYFISNIAFDTYNTERITLNSGANSTLFSLGDPAGIVNTSTKKAYINSNLKSIEIQFGSNDTWRATADFSKTIVRDKFVVRIIGLVEDHRNQWEGAFYKDERFFAAFTYRLFDRTYIRGNFETIQSKNRPESRFSLMDGFSGWIQAGTPIYNPAENTPIPDGLTLPSVVGFNNLVTYDSTSDTIPTVLMLSTNPIGIPKNNPFVNTIGPNGNDLDFRGKTIIDRNIFDYKSQSINTGESVFFDEDATIFNTSIEHGIGDKVNFEIAFYREDYESEFSGRFAESSYVNFPGSLFVNIDANTHLQDGTENPNFLRPYVDTISSFRRFQQNTNQEIRFTTAYHIDFENYDRSLRWLGSHDFTGVISQTRLIEKQVSVHPHWVISEDLNQTIETRFDISGFQATGSRVYVGDAVTFADPFPNGLAAPSLGFNLPSSMEVNVFNDFTGIFEKHQIPIREITRFRSNTSRIINSLIVGMHSFFLDNRIITTVGYRKDLLNIKRAQDLDDTTNENVFDPTFFGVLQDAEDLGNLEIYTLGIVLNPISWLQIHANFSENFHPNQINAEKTNVLGKSIDPNSGISRDFGFSLNFQEGKFDLKINWFEVKRDNVDDDEIVQLGFFPAVTWFENDLLQRFVIPAGRESQWIPAPDSYITSIADPGEVGDISRFTANGIEIMATYNPSPNWRILFNTGNQKTVQSDRGVFIQEWLTTRWSSYQQFFDIESTRPNIAGPSLEEYSKYILEPLAELVASEGRTSPQQREWRISLVTNYDFSEGPLKGCGLGVAYRWEDRPIIGYSFTENDDSDSLFFSRIKTDVENPHKGSSQSHTDFWLRYKRDFLNGKLNWTVQLNVRNLFNQIEPIAIVSDSDGNPATYIIPESRRFLITNTLSF